MSTTTIEQHHERWSELPLFAHDRWVVTDEDCQAWGDIIYMRSLVEDLVAEAKAAGRVPTAPGGLIEFDTDLYLEPWPEFDPVAALLAAWRAEAVAA